jgi:hypothetical protein
LDDGVEHLQLANRNSLDIRWKTSRAFAGEELLRPPIRPAPYHGRQHNACRYAPSMPSLRMRYRSERHLPAQQRGEVVLDENE